MTAQRWILEALGGEPLTMELPASGSTVIGSSTERAGFVLEGQGVEEAHCAVGRTKEGDWAVKDLGSRYGTYVNGQRVSAARLKLGDQLVLGSRRLEVRPAPAPKPSIGSELPRDTPQRINGYRIERLIGKGGMGRVFLAVQESLRRPVALKVLEPRLAADRDFVQRFQAEAQAAAALSHPNVVVVYDVGAADGAHYLSMEFMAGGSLEQKLAASGPVPWKDVLAALTDAAAGLAYAESKGIVHRDIKPANLMYSGTGTVKIADLGLATTIEQEASEVVGGRKVFGTPHFISPEQARGEAVDHRSDLYSLGASAYRLLSGRTPFEGATTRDILRALQTEEPRPLKELVPDVPAEVDAVVERLMAKDPAERFPTAEALRRECERLKLSFEHGAQLDRPAGSRLQTLVGIALLLVVGAGAAAWWVLRDGGGEGRGRDAVAGGPDVDRPANDGPDLSDPDFFEPEKAPEVADEEAKLREREREAGRLLRELPPFLSDVERERALEDLVAGFPGTSAAASAERELEALRAGSGAPAASLEEVVAGFEAELASLREQDADLAAMLRAIEGFRPPPEVGPAFQAHRDAAAVAAVEAEVRRLGTRLDEGTQLALDGRFDELRALLAGLADELAGLEELPGGPERLTPLLAVRDDVAARVERVDDEEQFFLANQERARRRALGTAVGPGSGVVKEIVAFDRESLSARLRNLPPELAERPIARQLAETSAAAGRAFDTLERELDSGGWRRQSVIDPRTGKVREVRDLTAEGLVFERGSELETVYWRETRAAPEWWEQLFRARLGRDWTPEEAREVVGLLRLMGAARGAQLAGEMLAPGGRGILQPRELEELRHVFAPAQAWLEEARESPEVRADVAREAAAAERLARALEAAQGRSWTSAAADLEVLLADQRDCLIVALLSSGADWKEAPPRPDPVVDPLGAAASTDEPSPDDEGGEGGTDEDGTDEEGASDGR